MKKFISLNKLWILIFSIFIASQTHATLTQPVVKDSVITTAIKSKIALDQSISVFNIHVSTKNGVVTLAGKVDSDTDASGLVELAQSTDGVKDVVTNKLMINESHQPIKDTVITAKIRGLFIKDKLFSNKDIAAMDIKVETNNGVVYLSGVVDNKKQARNAIKIARSVAGVKKVESRIDVTYTP